MSFLEDPRLRQRWNQISHDAEGVAENAAAGIWKFQHRYIAPCLANVCNSLDACTGVCLGGDREERARRARERERGARRTRAEYSFDFYDDWDDDDDALAGYGYYGYHGDGGGGGGSGSGGGGGGGGILGTDWDRLLAGTGASSRGRHGGAGAAGAGGDVVDQPRRKGTMNYGTRRKTSVQEDPTVIPSTSSFGFLGRLPFKIGGTLRYKPSAANLQDHPGAVHHHSSAGERQPLLGGGDDDEDAGAEYHGGGRDGEVIFQRSRSGKEADDDDEYYNRHGHQRRGAGGEEIYNPKTRKRSSTTGSGATSDSYRSRGDLFPSDGEGEEDAVPLDDEFAVALDRVTTDDRSSSIGGGGGGGGGRTRSVKKGKRRADSMGNNPRGGGGGSYNPAMISRSVSRTTIASIATTASSAQVMASPSVMRRPSSPSGSAPGMEETRQQLEDEENPAERHGPATPLAHQSPRSPGVHFDDIPEPPPFLPRNDDGSLGQIVGGMEVEVPDQPATNTGVTAAAPAAPTAGSETAAPDRTTDQEFLAARLPNFQ